MEKENIHKIDLSHNRIADLSVMKDLPIMLDLNLSHNLIEDLGTLPQKNAVHKLNLEHNFIKDPNPLTAGAITALLRSLKINYNSFTDWSALKEKFDKEFDDNGYSSERLGKIIRHFPADAAEAQTLLNPKTIEQVRAENNQLDKNVTDFFAQLKQQNDAKKDDPKQNDAKKDDPKQNDAKKDNPKQNTLVPMLNWGLKASFRKYVSGNFAHGKWELSEGAAGEFTFPIKDAAAFDLNKLQDLQFAGKVHFTAHNGLLDMTISNPRIVNNNQGRQLIATMSYLPFDQKNIHAILSGKQNPAADESKRVTATVALAELSEPQITGEGAAKKIHFADVNLTADGAKAFANFYDEGQALDPITITFTAGGEKPNRTENGESEKQIQPQPQAPPQPQLQPQPPTQHEQLQKCEADPHKKRITNGSLSWALRSSFTSYLRGPIAHGKWDLAGASWDGAQFSFPATGGLYNTATRTGKIYYSGSVHFTGHNGVLDIRISSPALVINGNTASLYMNVSGSDMSGNKFSLGRVNFATVTFNGIKVTDSRLSFSGAAVRLTADGAKAFAGFYKAGEKLAPMSSSVALVSATTCDKDGNLVEYDAFGNTLARTGAAAGNLIIWSLLIALMGAGILTPAYRRRKNIYQAENA
ncbi:HtaA domain-containing protein [Arcanobacterium hippocoleae]